MRVRSPGWRGAVALVAAVAVFGILVAPHEGVARRARSKRTAHRASAQTAPASSEAPDDTTWGTTGSSVDVDAGKTPMTSSMGGASTSSNPFAGLGWLNGCWALEDAKRRVEEQWTTSGGVLMVGSAKEYARPKDKLVESELTRIEFLGGQLVYIATPASQPADSFPAIESNASRIVFENPRHDFPQRIGYERIAPDSVVAWIEGTQGGNARRVEYPYHRERCGQHSTGR